MGDEAVSQIHERTEILIGADGLAQLWGKRVLIAGLGGVGGFAAEVVARANIGRMTLLDHDVVGVSNMNRQLVALRSTIGLPKTGVMKQRIADINPDIEVQVNEGFLDPEGVEALLAGGYDYVIDCIDSIACKAALVHGCQRLGIPVASSMGAGGRTDVSKVRIGLLAHTGNCPLAREMRRRLRKIGGSLDFPVVYSTEQPVKGTEHRPLGSASHPGRPRSVNGTISYLPALFGVMLGGFVVRELLAG
jgi:tRNA threonylcarbamoyladenosine dehydratase